MKIAFVGDIHGDIDAMYAYLGELQLKYDFKIDVVVHVGDFGIYLPPLGLRKHSDAIYTFAKYWQGRKVAPIPTYICPGNHEDYTVLKAWQNAPSKVHNMHLIPDGGVVKLSIDPDPDADAPISIGAIWGNFSYRSYKNPRRVHESRKSNPQHSPKAMHITREPIERMLLSGGKLDVLITHDAPQGMMPVMGQPSDFIKMQLGVDDDEPCGGCAGFNEIFVTNKPRYHFFGHFHIDRVVHEGRYVMDGKVNEWLRSEALHCFNYNREASVRIMDVVHGDETMTNEEVHACFDPIKPLH